MTGGSEKIFGGVQINFTLIFGREDQKKIFILAVYLFSEHKPRSGGTFIAWQGAAESDGADLASCPQIQGRRKRKKRLQREILGLVFAYTHVFRPGRKLYLRLGGAEVPKCTPVAPALLLSFGAQSSLGGHTSRLGSTLLAWGAQAVIWGCTAPKCIIILH